MTLVDAKELYSVLQGGVPPDGWQLGSRPRLSARAALSVIWFLQERYRIIPDNFEQCCKCRDLFDSHAEGGHGDGRNSQRWYCGVCLTA